MMMSVSIVISPSFLLKEKKQKFKAAQHFPKKNSFSRKQTKPFKGVCGDGRYQAAPMVRYDKLQ